MELFGCEDLLIEMARNGIKIELHPAQKALFKQCNRGDLFEYEGLPQITVYPYTKPINALTCEEYKWYAILLIEMYATF